MFRRLLGDVDGRPRLRNRRRGWRRGLIADAVLLATFVARAALGVGAAVPSGTVAMPVTNPENAVATSPAAALEATGVEEVVAGSLVRWPAQIAGATGGVSKCRLRSGGPQRPSSERGFEFSPQSGDCLLPIDLLATGELEAARMVGGSWETRRLKVAEYPYPEQRLTVDDEHVNLSARNEERAARERREVDALWSLSGVPRFVLPLAPPLSPLPKAGRFGSRRVFNGQPRSPHTGADYGALRGTPVKAAAAGTVRLAADHFFSGNSVFIDHGDGLVTMYFHLDELRVKNGQEVRTGDVVGTVGSTGRSTGPHLHFGLRWHGQRLDPSFLLRPVDTLPEVGAGEKKKS